MTWKKITQEDDENWALKELEMTKPSSEPFFMAIPSKDGPTDTTRPWFDLITGTRIFPNLAGQRLDLHILQDHNGSIKDHELIHFGHDEETDWTNNIAHYHDGAFLNRVHNGQMCEWDTCPHLNYK